jgi:hypothetical protein
MDTWHGSKSYKIAKDPCPPGYMYGDHNPTGNGYAAFVAQGLRKALVATDSGVGGQHDLTLNADNETRDILLAFLSIPNDTRRSTIAGSPPPPATWPRWRRRATTPRTDAMSSTSS